MQELLKKLGFWLFIPIVLLLLSIFIGYFGLNIKLLGLPQNQKGLVSILLDQNVSSNQYSADIQNYFVNKIIIKEPTTTKLKYSLQLLYSNINTQFDGYVFPEINQDVIRINANVKKITISIQDSTSRPEIYIDNTIKMNKYIILFIFTVLLAAYFLIFLRNVITKKIEYGFLIVALAVGISISVIIPANTTMSWDDQIHYAKSYGLSYWPGIAQIKQNAFELEDIEWSNSFDGISYFHIFDTFEDQRNYYTVIDSHLKTVNESKYSLSYMDAGYFAQSLFLSFARILKLPFYQQFILGRIGNMLLYVGICFLSIKLAIRYKIILATIALLPVSMFLAGSYSYDPTVIAFCLLGFSLAVSEILTPNIKLTWLHALLMLAAFVIGCCPKAVYIPLILTCLLLPESKFETRKLKIYFRVGVIILFVLMMATFVLPTLIHAPEKGDLRGGATSIAGQLSFIMHNPLSYLKLLGKNIWDSLGFYVMEKARIGWAYLGNSSQNIDFLSLMFQPRFFSQQPMSLPVHNLPDIMTV